MSIKASQEHENVYIFRKQGLKNIETKVIVATNLIFRGCRGEFLFGIQNEETYLSAVFFLIFLYAKVQTTEVDVVSKYTHVYYIQNKVLRRGWHAQTHRDRGPASIFWGLGQLVARLVATTTNSLLRKGSRSNSICCCLCRWRQNQCLTELFKQSYKLTLGLRWI